MSGYRKVNYYELCRLCTNSEGDKLNIFREEGRRRQLHTKIQACLPIQILAEDSLPKVICHECIQKLENIMEFRESVISAESMLVSYFTSLRCTEDFFKEGKVYVKNIEKTSTSQLTTTSTATITTTPPTATVSPPEEVDPIKIDSMPLKSEQIVETHQQPIVVGNINASNIQIISGVPARIQQYKCSMQTSGNVAAAIVEANAETFTFHQPTQNRINGQHSQTAQIPVQINQQLRQVTQQPGNQTISQQRQQNQFQLSQEFQQLRELEKQHQIQLHQLEKMSPNHDNQIQNNNSTNKSNNSEQNQSDKESHITTSNDNFSSVQTSPEVLLGLSFKDSGLTSRDDVKDFREYIKNVDGSSIGQISEFLRIRTEPPLLTVNPQVICQTNREIICAECGKTFETTNQLENHDCTNSSMITDDITETVEKDDNNQSNSSFSCDICNKPFKRKEHLFQHRKLHTGERPFVCPTCSKAFSRKEHLVRHSVSHTGQKMHECEMCGKSFSRKDNLHKHRKTHGVSGPYVCETCGKSFVVKHYYLMHLTTHASSSVDDPNHDPLPYKCDLCFKAFSVKQYLTTHKLRHRSKANSKQQQQQQGNQQPVQQQTVSSPSNNDIITGDPNSSNLPTSNDQNGDDIQSSMEQSDQQQQNNSFVSNQFQGNVPQQFQ